MNVDFQSIDTTWAWAPFEPTAERPWNRSLAAHLHRRAGFAATWDERERASRQEPAEVIEQLLEPGDEAARSEQQLQPLDDAVLAGGNVEGLPAWWLYRMLHSRDPLLEKLTLFWHGHFATSAAKVADIRLMFQQHQLFRRYARGNFAPLVHAISRDPAMLEYLDSATNRKTHPNENYARELMELFCLGPGAYTEKDIQELARAFTGWEVHHKKFAYNDYEHDRRAKTILGHIGEFGGEQGIGVVLSHAAAPRFIARKLVRFFVCDEPTLPDDLIEPLAKELRESDFNVGPTVRTILSSHFFFSEYAVGRKVRSPVELGIGLMRSLETHSDLNALSQRLAELGQRVFYPPNVKGWDGGRSWINSSALLGRANLVRDIAASAELKKLASRAGAESPEEIVDWGLELLVAAPAPTAVRNSLVDLAGRKQDEHQRLVNVIHAIGTLPEFQLN